MLANQLYGPYGTQRYSGGSMAPYTDKGYTGQYNDALTGLDYYNARYYDPTVGVFLSADTVQGNGQGMNPYAYVGGNPETMTDPTGRYIAGNGGQTYYNGSSYYMQGGEAYSVADAKPYNGGGFVNGWYPGYGSNTVKLPVKFHPRAISPPKIKSTNSGCGGLTTSQCSKGTQAQQSSENHDQFMSRILQLLASGIGLGVDIAKLLQDFGGWDFGSALRWFGDIIGIAGDLSGLLSSLASLIQNSTLQTIADGLSFFANAAASIYKAATSSFLGMGVLIAGFYTVKALFSEGDIGLEAEQVLAGAASAFTGQNLWLDGASVAISAIQSAAGYFNWQYDVASGESVSQYCQANSDSCK